MANFFSNPTREYFLFLLVTVVNRFDGYGDQIQFLCIILIFVINYRVKSTNKTRVLVDMYSLQLLLYISATFRYIATLGHIKLRRP